MASSVAASPLAPAGALLGYVVFNPTTSITVTTSSVTFTDVDSVNLVISFVAPASGAVIVQLSGVVSIDVTTGATYWNLRDAGGNIANTVHIGTSTAAMNTASTRTRVTGLTPGTTYTWKWGWSVNSVSRLGTMGFGQSLLYGAASMAVYDAAITPGTVGIAIPYVETVRTLGDITLNSQAVADVGLGDLVLPAAIGDVIEYGISGQLEAVGQYVGFDVYTVVAGSPVNPFGPGLSGSEATLQGVPGWAINNAAVGAILTGSATRTLVAGDLASGTVTMRLRYSKVTTTARLLYAQTNIPLKAWAKNLRH